MCKYLMLFLFLLVGRVIGDTERSAYYRPGSFMGKTQESPPRFLMVIPYSTLNGGKAYIFSSVEEMCKIVPDGSQDKWTPFFYNLYDVPDGFIVYGVKNNVIPLNEAEMTKVEKITNAGKKIFLRPGESKSGQLPEAMKDR